MLLFLVAGQINGMSGFCVAIGIILLLSKEILNVASLMRLNY